MLENESALNIERILESEPEKPVIAILDMGSTPIGMLTAFWTVIFGLAKHRKLF